MTDSPDIPRETPIPLGDGTVQGFEPQGYYTVPKADVCKALTCCGDDDPLGNWTSAAAPTNVFVVNSFSGDRNDVIMPQLGDSWTAFNCHGSYLSGVSQADANAQASAAMQDCIGGDWTDPSGARISPAWNEAIACSSSCSGGGTFWSSVPASRYLGRSQNEANAIALGVCQAQIAVRKFCILSEWNGGCVGTAFSDAIWVSAYQSGMSVSLVSGTLPDGLALVGIDGSGFIWITGTPTTSGTSSFTLRVTAPSGDFAERSLSLTVLEITAPSPLTGGSVGNAYSLQMTAAGGSGSYTWSIISGILPDGLTMDAAGLITGTPTTPGTITGIVFQVTDIG